MRLPLVIFQLLNFAALIGLMMLVIWAVYTTFRRQDEREADGKEKKIKHGDIPADAGLRDLIAAGELQEAEELYQRFTGVDEFTARDAVADLAREIRLTQISTQVQQALDTGDKAAAIEAYQAQTGASLAEALAYVEALQTDKRA